MTVNNVNSNELVEKVNLWMSEKTLGDTSLKFTEIMPERVRATFEVTPNLHQPAGILNGGYSLLIAESVASVGARYAAAPGYVCVAVEVNASHLESVASGIVSVEAGAVRLGKNIQVWEIQMQRADGKTSFIGRCTFLVRSLSNLK